MEFTVIRDADWQVVAEGMRTMQLKPAIRIISSWKRFSTLPCGVRPDGGVHPGQRSSSEVIFREYVEKLNKPRVMVRNRTFEPRYTHREWKVLRPYEQVIGSCLAKWLWVNYQINDFPYYDLNIVQVFTDLRACTSMCKSIMTFFEKKLSKNHFEKIHYILVPLYKLDKIPSAIMDGIPGHVELVNDIKKSPFHKTGGKLGALQSLENWIQDPVYVLFLNDILRNIAHDLVRFGDRGWEQCYVCLDNDGQPRDYQFHENPDPLCQRTLDTIFESGSMGYPTQNVYVPSQLIQLFDVMQSLIPEYRLFAIDHDPTATRTGYTRWLQDIIYGTLKTTPGPLETLLEGGHKLPIQFQPDFKFLNSLYTNLENSKFANKMCEVTFLRHFVNDWTDTSASQSSQMQEQYKSLQGSPLTVLQAA
ncbi:type II protein arginine methyltransferase KNAG_0C06290 [Huiozyma naganishii CBS 8797]|uniref:type II protein arginine methyltransferase n=1 Tax=Huiozyma naganishii (strain ATCC MYA-139 / BCRC 22969 / CBS 8797 / KCTC 17520 / NBRC 10181 / NCYC 3082 / Yp74L-3) TaxID=1071383 RepID=J7S584_HUIN7|nr:hypothetical protein KNAG_0C06290 [Kazachstania naganishii CBS 8797]CCK69724.1 hypothetical protein KNAG_0C06290 [Kazachstania naganishii CBS 8797]